MTESEEDLKGWICLGCGERFGSDKNAALAHQESFPPPEKETDRVGGTEASAANMDVFLTAEDKHDTTPEHFVSYRG